MDKNAVKVKDDYVPSEQILKKYADVLVKFALGGGKGVKKGEVVFIQIHECSKPMLIPLRRAVLECGAHPILQYIPDDVSRDFYEKASDEQITFFPSKLLKGRIDEINHSIYIIAETNKHELEGIDPKRLMLGQKSFKPYMEWRDKKENAGKFTWTLAMYGTHQMAKEAKMSLKEYWAQIIKACYLDDKNPIKTWKKVYSDIDRIIRKLDSMKIQKVRVEAKGTDITIGIGEKRAWKGGSGRNVPTFEIFTSPNCNDVNGKIQFTEPLYIYGNLIKDVYLEFKDGIVTKSSASVGEKVLKEMIATKNANMIGEFSMTDGRMSKITKFMGETLFDENVGGPQGNTHLALGKAYKDCYQGDPSKVSEKEWKRLGYNDSSVHTDIVATSRRKVTAILPDGSKKVIYDDGKFLI
ncbi:MAG: aminopeptidase [Candidatus Woesearchaeota archaeon]|jgi:aminopeptidase